MDSIKSALWQNWNLAYPRKKTHDNYFANRGDLFRSAVIKINIKKSGILAERYMENAELWTISALLPSYVETHVHNMLNQGYGNYNTDAFREKFYFVLNSSDFHNTFHTSICIYKKKSNKYVRPTLLNT